MWSLRRLAFPLKKHGYCVEVTGLLLCGEKHDIASYLSGDNLGGCYPAQLQALRLFSREESYHTSPIFGKIFLGSRRLSSQETEKSCDENAVKETFLEHEDENSAIVSEAINVDGEVGEEFDLEPRFLDDYLSDSEHGLYFNYREPLKGKSSLELLRTIMDSPSRCVSSILKSFVEAGDDLSHAEASKIIFILWKRRMYHGAFQISEWLESTKRFEHNEHDYASRLDLIAKVQGVDVAEKYMESVPDSFRGELLYRTLLANFVRSGNMEKSEAVFGEMRNFGLPITIYALNQMIILYRMRDKRKIPDILLFMEKENLTPSHLIYKILIASKGKSGDITGMEQLVDAMKSQGLQPDTPVLTVLATHYISEGLKDKAIAILKEIGGGNSQQYIRAHSALLPLYASLDMADDVSRIWNHCKSDPTMQECVAAIGAWGKLGKVEEAEAVFEMALQKFRRLSSRLFSKLLRVYVLNNQISKGKEFIERMRHFRCWIGPLVWDELVRFYVGAGDVEKAASVLSKAAQMQSVGPVRPLFNTYIFVMEQYAKHGDIHSTEKWFLRLKQCGYTGRLRPFQILIQAYLKAKTPAYGLRERMMAENVFPNKDFSVQLSKIEALQRDVLLFGSKRDY